MYNWFDRNYKNIFSDHLHPAPILQPHLRLVRERAVQADEDVVGPQRQASDRLVVYPLVQADLEPVRDQVGRHAPHPVARERRYRFDRAVEREAFHQQHLDQQRLRLPALDQGRLEAGEEDLQRIQVVAVIVPPCLVVGAAELVDAEAQVFGGVAADEELAGVLRLQALDDAADALLADVGDGVKAGLPRWGSRAG